MPKRIAQVSLDFTGLYESELLTELMLRFWHHPNADDADFRNTVLEIAAEALQASVRGESLVEGVPPDQMNIVCAIWFAEWNRIQNDDDINAEERVAIEKWLNTLRRSVPACFCDQQYLD
ncbi:MAG: hypothetical protein WCH39_13105 [Schlesneria sp.]|jgi:hypothetical protein